MSVEKKIRTEIDWSKMEKDVVFRIHLLKRMCAEIDGKPLADEITRDMIIPCLKHLMHFCDSIQENEKEEE